MSQQKKKTKVRIVIRNIFIGAIALLFLLFLFAVYYVKCVLPEIKPELTLEVGSSKPVLTDFFSKEYNNKYDLIHLVSGIDSGLDMTEVSDHTVVIEVIGKEYTSILHVVDTVAPTATTKDQTHFNLDAPLKAEDFIEEITDMTQTEVEYVSTPDFEHAGTSEVAIRLTDQGKNETIVYAKLTVIEDTTPPVIDGAKDMSVAVGNTISYKRGITVTDDYDENPVLTIDNSAVDLNTPGNYTVTYVATDASGNQSEVEITVQVKRPSVELATEEMVNAEADKVLAQITTPGMSQYEMAQAIFNWVHNKIAYSDHTPKTNWVQGAYRGLVERKGDCFVYAMTSKCLLTRAGITNMDIEKIPAASRHYWNLIDLGDGWYHFDATRRRDGATFFYWTDAQLMEYSNAHNGSHNYDPSLYPTIQ